MTLVFKYGKIYLVPREGSGTINKQGEINMAHVPKYNPGQIKLDLPTANYVYTLPLLSFADIYGTLGLSLVFNYSLSTSAQNHFNMSPGFKLNLHKKLILDGTAADKYIDADGKIIELIKNGSIYTFVDDSQRIMRRKAGYFVVENPDYSTELFVPDGRFFKVFDKYGNEVIVNGYDISTGRLATIKYRGSKTISLSYDTSDRISKISYYAGGNCNTTFSYTTDALTISHYSGMEYAVTRGSGMNINVEATSGEDNHATIYKAALVQNGNNIVTSYSIKSENTDPTKNNEETIDSTQYTYPVAISDCTEGHSYIEITDFHGVKNRIQYNGDKPKYSYEVEGEDVCFVMDDSNTEKFFGVVKIEDTDNTDELKIYGKLGITDGENMYKSNFEPEWSYNTNGRKGYFVLTGWINCKGTNVNQELSEVIIRTYDTQNIVINPGLLSNGHWKFFEYPIYTEGEAIVVCPDNPAYIMLKDMRVTYFGEVVSPSGKSRMNVADDLIVYHDESGYRYYPLLYGNNNFFDGTTCLNPGEEDDVYPEDILRYKINQKLGVNLNEFYIRKCKTVYSSENLGNVMYKFADNYYPLAKCYLARRIRTPRGVVTNLIIDDIQGKFLVYRTLYSAGEVISWQELDSKLDAVSAESENVTRNWVRNANGLLTSEEVFGLYTRTTAYGEDSSGNPTVAQTNEFGEQTVYTLDEVWGAVTSVTLPDGTVVTDEYDDDMSALLERTFGQGRSNSIEYSLGNPSAYETGALRYTMAYSGGKLTSVEKCAARVEEHEYSTNSTNNSDIVISYYPQKSGKVYSDISRFDKYGRLTSLDGAVTNFYHSYPLYDEETGEPRGELSNAGAFLSISTDEMADEETRFEYSREGALICLTTCEQNNLVNEKREEEYTYDGLGRLTNRRITFDVPAAKSISEEITYSKEETNLTADGTVKEYNFKYNDNLISKSTNTTNIYGILTQKRIEINNTPFKDTIVYDDTRVDRVMSELDYSVPEHIRTVMYDYDPIGRIKSETRVDTSPTQPIVSYEYDQYGQLEQENNKELNKTYVYGYDSIGNITCVKEYAYSNGALNGNPSIKEFAYDSDYSDRLISYNGKSITYNSLGCMSSYDSKNYNWTKGRLSSIIKGKPIGALPYEGCFFTYNGYGQRTGKSYTKDNKSTTDLTGSYTYETSYTYDSSGRLIREFCEESFQSGYYYIYELIYVYDESGIIGVLFSDNGAAHKAYYYVRNLQGDVISVHDEHYTKVAEYAYDAYGNCTVTNQTDATFAKYNPIRYRGYYYDRETKLYWVQTRYYSPEFRRWISPDSTGYLAPDTVNGLNLYCYCMNNPIMYVDPTGHSPEWWQWLVSGAEVVVGIALCFVPGIQGFGVTLIGTGAGSMINGYINESNGGSFNAGWWGGQVSGIVSAIPGIGVSLGAFAGSVITDWIDYGWDKIDWNKALITSFIAWGVSLFPTMIGEMLSKYNIYDKAIYPIIAYNAIFASTANSVVNVFWRGANNERRN